MCKLYVKVHCDCVIRLGTFKSNITDHFGQWISYAFAPKQSVYLYVRTQLILPQNPSLTDSWFGISDLIQLIIFGKCLHLSFKKKFFTYLKYLLVRPILLILATRSMNELLSVKKPNWSLTTSQFTQDVRVEATGFETKPLSEQVSPSRTINSLDQCKPNRDW